MLSFTLKKLMTLAMITILDQFLNKKCQATKSFQAFIANMKELTKFLNIKTKSENGETNIQLKEFSREEVKLLDKSLESRESLSQSKNIIATPLNQSVPPAKKNSFLAQKKKTSKGHFKWSLFLFQKFQRIANLNLDDLLSGRPNSTNYSLLLTDSLNPLDMTLSFYKELLCSSFIFVLYYIL